MIDPIALLSTNAKVRRFFFFWLPILFVAWLFIPGFYYSPEMTARVVSTDGKPVAGAIVVASWTMTRDWNNVPAGPLKVAEVVTDADGRFRIPAWGPTQPDFALNIQEPVVRIFKPGLVPLIIYNTEGVGMSSAHRIITFRLQGRTITLEKFQGSPSDYEKSLGWLMWSLDRIYGTSKLRCQWRDRYRILLAVNDMDPRLTVGRPVVAQYKNDSMMTNCGDPKQGR